MSDVDLEVGGRDAKPTCAHIRPVWETRDLLLGCCREAKPLELGTDAVLHTVVAGPNSQVPLAGVSVIAFRVVPAAPHLEIARFEGGRRSCAQGAPSVCKGNRSRNRTNTAYSASKKLKPFSVGVTVSHTEAQIPAQA